MRILELVAAILVATTTFNGCAMPSSQQNLDNQLKAMIGKSLDVPRYHLRPELLIDQKELSNNLLQLRYRYLGDCVLVVEANTKTRIIVNAWAKGSEKSCILPP